MDDYSSEKERIDLTGDESMQYGNFWKITIYNRPNHTPANDYDADHTPRHQLFGNPSCIQYRFYVPGDNDGTQLLLQTGFDRVMDMLWGDASFPFLLGEGTGQPKAGQG
jgi:hypothetical protein